METDLTEAFIHNLHEIYFIEKFLVKELDKLASQATMKQIKQDLMDHRKETVKHVANIEKIFELAGLKKDEMKLESWNAMDREATQMIKSVSEDSKDFFILENAAKAERIEITYYESLILASREIGLTEEGEILSLLRDNLADEEKALMKGMASMKEHVSLFHRKIH